MIRKVLFLVGLLVSAAASAEQLNYSGQATVQSSGKPFRLVSLVGEDDEHNDYGRYFINFAANEKLNVSLTLKPGQKWAELKIGNAVIAIENKYLTQLENKAGKVKLARYQMDPIQKFDLELTVNEVNLVACQQDANAKAIKHLSLNFSSRGQEVVSVQPQVVEAKNCGTKTFQAEANPRTQGDSDATGIREQ